MEKRAGEAKNTMVKYELYRIFGNKKNLIILAICLILRLVLSSKMQTVMYEGFHIKVYEYYMELLEGEYSENKAEWVENEYINMLTWIEQKELYEEQYMKNEITSNEYRELSELVKSAEYRMETFMYVLEKTRYFEGCEEDVTYFYDIEINDYLSGMKADIFHILVMILLITAIFTEDYQSNVSAVIRTSRYGREKLFRIRFLLVNLISFVVGVMFFLGEFLVKEIKFELGDFSTNIKSLLIMEKASLHCSLGTYIFITIVYRLYFSTVLAYFIMFMAQWTKKSISAYLGCLGLVFLPEFLSDFTGKTISGLSLYKNLGAYEVFCDYYETFLIPNYFFTMMVWGCISVLMILLTKKQYVRGT